MTIEKLVGNVLNFGDFSAKIAQKDQENDANFSDILSEQERVKAKSGENIAAHNAAVSPPEKPDAKIEFHDFMGKDTAERMRQQVLLALGITEEELDAMPPEERQKVEMKIAAIIEEKIRMATEEQLEKSAIPNDEAQKDDWLSALGLPQDGRVQVGFNAFGDLKMTGQNALATTAAEEIL